ncbi:MAG: CDP-diacylglycerol--serine O-phosphatidyltransferase [Bacteroidales bacterium]|nr:CDP-diacylglycerol--serine O-phosphatidyltransferase [Bacteroidales bacterium]OQB71438.1 MAG: CDP-alcohol phosphatidyltransferase [Bacteroidetes bacterium ADurb.Bin139]HNZ70378.1 CDP-diacylglycerol--serine O-phosphatidyltransferase [Prolixibacteraceae bacterium]MCZ2315956.1 CDP-diacylglycerol--serine O-phosphatidyltransferase [Bacteroidales bacterium]HOG25883.1 CDP-diacylglycerol--serine O-phosphatidyltransferase [Bacteroidales bacterium]
MKKILLHIPNAITSLNLLCGALGIAFVFRGRLDIAFWLLIAAALFDFLDGFAARLLNAYSPVGKELDSLADAISFGLLPAFMLYALYLPAAPRMWISFIPLVVAVFTAIRLAKFNVDARQSESFLGLPSPASALLIAAAVFYTTGNPLWKEFMQTTWFIPCLSVVISFLLISELPMFSLKFKGWSFGSNKVRYLFLVLCLILVIVLLVTGNHPGLAMMGCIGLYIVMSGILRISGHYHQSK